MGDAAGLAGIEGPGISGVGWHPGAESFAHRVSEAEGRPEPLFHRLPDPSRADPGADLEQAGYLSLQLPRQRVLRPVSNGEHNRIRGETLHLAQPIPFNMSIGNSGNLDPGFHPYAGGCQAVQQYPAVEGPDVVAGFVV